MGTDIHCYVERREADGAWHLLPPPARDLDRWPRVATDDGYVSPFWGPGFYEGPVTPGSSLRYHWYGNRNYDVFAVLADVRNGTGFAGCRTSSGFVPVSEPRGIPEDGLSAELNALVPTWDHSVSYLTLRELLAIDWEQRVTHYGVIHFKDYQDWRTHGGQPREWSGDVFGRMVKVLTLPQAEEALTAYLNGTFWVRPGEPAGGTDLQHLYVRVQWTATYRETCEDFVRFVDDYLVPLGPPDRVRIVFGFDS